MEKGGSGILMRSQSTLEGLFERIYKTKTIFRNKEALRHSYTPENLPHRDNQINQLATILVSALRKETPSNIIMYGKTGTGKTAVVKYVGKELEKISAKYDANVHFIYMNCEVVDTQYRVLANLCNNFCSEKVPLTGWPTDQLYSLFIKEIDTDSKVVVIVLDEIDKLVKKSGDDVLYNLTRSNDDLKNAKASIIGISNDLKFTEYLDPRVISSLGEEEIIFPPYDAIQLEDILKQRVSIAFKEGVLEETVVPLCAAYAAREHGDARKALDLLRVSGEIAERKGNRKVTEEDVRMAKDKIEQDRIIEVVKTLPKQSKLILYSILQLKREDDRPIMTGEVFEVYRELCKRTSLDVLTHRRVSDLISELDMLGIISAKVVSKGRYGRTKEIYLTIPSYRIKTLLQEEIL